MTNSRPFIRNLADQEKIQETINKINKDIEEIKNKQTDEQHNH